MKIRHLSGAQAAAIHRDYKHLSGTQLDARHTIDYILVAPYSRILQWKFVQDVMQAESAAGMPPPDNPAGRYDVLLVSKAADTARGFIITDLRSYLAARAIPYDDARYFCLRHKTVPVSIVEAGLRSPGS